MKKKEKTVCQIIRFRGNIETFIVSIDLFASSNSYPRVTYSDHKVTYSDPKVTHNAPTHPPLPPTASPGHHLAIS